MGSNVIIMLPPPPPTTIWTYSTDIEKELDYVIAQLNVSETLHRMVMDSIDNLRELGYPQHHIDFIKEQFKKPIRKRELPQRSPQITDYMDLVKKHVVRAFVEGLKISTEEAEKMAEKIITGVKNKHSIDNLPGIKAAIEAMVRVVVTTTIEAQKKYGIVKLRVPPSPPKPEERKVELPPSPPRAAVPEEVPPRPLIVKGPPELELMKKEIKERIEEEKRRRLKEGPIAGEQKEHYRSGKDIAAGYVDVYSRWTYDNFRVIINRTTDIGILAGLGKHIDESTATPLEKSGLRKIIAQREAEIRRGGPEIRKQVEQQEAEGQLAQIERQSPGLREREDDVMEDVMQVPENYTEWEFGDFEGQIPGLADPEDLEELLEYIDATDKLTKDEAKTLREMIKERIKKVEKTGS